MTFKSFDIEIISTKIYLTKDIDHIICKYSFPLLWYRKNNRNYRLIFNSNSDFFHFLPKHTVWKCNMSLNRIVRMICTNLESIWICKELSQTYSSGDNLELHGLRRFIHNLNKSYIRLTFEKILINALYRLQNTLLFYGLFFK